MSKIEQIKDLKSLLDSGALNQEQYLKLLNEIIDKSEATIIDNNVTQANVVEAKSEYESVTIGNQIWMTDNLNVKTFRNGDPIFEASNKKQWIHAFKNKIPAWCYYDDDPINGEKYGLLYNFYAVHDARGLAPLGWKIPSKKNFEELTKFLGGFENAGRSLRSRDNRGTNKSGFNVKLSGYLNCFFEEMSTEETFMGKFYFEGLEEESLMWTNDFRDYGGDTDFDLSPFKISTDDRVTFLHAIETNFFSTRCVKDSDAPKCIKVSDRDSLFREAAEIVVNNQLASASLLQRKLKLGFNRGGRLIDELESAGIVGEFNGSKPREVYVKNISDLNKFF
jgi:uncharacterized protein (TIGR02145 family)